MPKLCTVDVWDTLLLRRCHPDAVKLHTANLLLLHCEDRLVPGLRDGHRLLQLRLAVEADLAKASARNPDRDDEYALIDVLDAWLERSGGVAPGLRAGLVAVLAEREWQQECEVSEADVGAIRLLSETTATSRMFLSDFYMPASSLQRLLEAKGLGQHFDGGYSSCDQGINKRSGRLFTWVQRQRGVEPQAHLHIGDNLVKDVQVPRSLGMQALHYVNRPQQVLTRRYGKQLWDRERLFIDIGKQVARSLRPPAVRLQARAYRYGASLAPLLAGFALFVLEAAQRDRLDAQYFLSREGELFAAACRIVRDASPQLAGHTPEPRVLEVSRLSTFLGSLRSISVDEMMRLWVAYPIQSLKAWAHSLDLPLEWVAGQATRWGIAFEQPLHEPWLDRRVRALLADEHVHGELVRLSAEHRRRLLAYLHQRGLGTAKRIGIVDIGWRGTIQDNLAWLLPDRQWFGSYLGLQAYQSAQAPNSHKHSFGTDLNQAPSAKELRLRLFAKLPLLEMLTNSDRGSVVGYQPDQGGAMQALRLVDDTENRVHHAVIAPLQLGMLDGVRIWAPAMRDQALRSCECRPLALQLWRRAVHSSPRFIRSALAQLHHNELFGRGQFSTAADF